VYRYHLKFVKNICVGNFKKTFITEKPKDANKGFSIFLYITARFILPSNGISFPNNSESK